ncbi:MAG: xanthine dehydrogenase family protein molybdopterin-binding subunit [Caulobacterales bacterium]|nr:xanthine dehydrogenase family protein molybdopterin-binding subunit [Caulobacterales bacterium]
MTERSSGLLAAPTRRTLLTVTALGGLGFAVGCGGPATPAVADGAARETVLNPFVRVGTDNTVTVTVKHLDMGQGVATGITTIVAEEMDAAWAQMRWEHAPANVALYADATGVQVTGGSRSIRLAWEQTREVAAAARAMLVEAAARAWDAPASEITVAGGVLSHPSGASGVFGDFAAAAAAIAPPETPALKDPARYALIGKDVPRIDTPEKTDGTAVYTIDKTVPGMLHAAIIHPPRFGASVAGFDAARARAAPGVTDVVETESGVAVVATSVYAALKGRDALAVEWDVSNAESRGSDALFAHFAEEAKLDGVLARDDGDVDAAFDTASTIVEADYQLPFLAHAALEPLNALVRLQDGELEIWNGSQAPQADQFYGAQISGLPLEKVKVHTLFAGGSFGRRANIFSDYVVDALRIAKAIDWRAPVKLQWTRENDMKGGRYRSMSHVAMRAALNEAGDVTAWRTRVVMHSWGKGTFLEDRYIHDGVDHPSVEGAQTNPYEVPNLRLEVRNPDMGITTAHWRSVGHTHNGFTMEAFIDEIAAASGQDPVALRRRLLANRPRHLAVLDKAVAEAGPAPTGPGEGRGVAMHESFHSYVAEVADVTLREDGTYKVNRVVCAVDCGLAINPDIVRAQMEGAIAMGLGAAMREQITVTDGEIDQSNYYDYFPIRMSDMPRIEVHILPSSEPPTGVGEPGLPPIAPAVVNALRAAGAKPIRRLPIGDRVALS